MSPLLAAIAVALTGSVGLFVVYLFRRVAWEPRAVRQRLAPPRGDLSFRPAAALRNRPSRIGLVDRLPLSAIARERMTQELTQAGVLLRPNEYLALRLLAAAAGAATAFLVVTAVEGAGLWRLGAALAGMVVGWLVPRLLIGRRRRKRARLAEEQLPDALTAIAKSLRAGTGLLQALAFAADETPAPLGPELQATLRDLQLGADPEVVFAGLVERVGSSDLDIAVTAIVIQRTVGGNLAEILTTVTSTIRERNKLEREIRSITARQRIMGNIVTALPIVVALLLIAINPDVGRRLLDSAPGRVSLAGAVGFELMGLYLIRRLGAIEI